MRLKVPEHILSIRPYRTGKPIEELKREADIAVAVKLASNENPIGPSPSALRAIAAALEGLNRYPDGGGHDLVEKIAAFQGVEKGSVVLGAGSDDLIGMLTRAFLAPGLSAIIPQPSFQMYEIGVRSSGAAPIFVPLKSMAIDLEAMAAAATKSTRMVFVCNPNNPTGSVVRKGISPHFSAHCPMAWSLSSTRHTSNSLGTRNAPGALIFSMRPNRLSYCGPFPKPTVWPDSGSATA